MPLKRMGGAQLRCVFCQHRKLISIDSSGRNSTRLTPHEQRRFGKLPRTSMKRVSPPFVGQVASQRSLVMGGGGPRATTAAHPYDGRPAISGDAGPSAHSDIDSPAARGSHVGQIH